MNCAGVSTVEFKKTKYWLEIKLFIMLYKCSNSTPPEHFPPVKLARKRLLPPPPQQISPWVKVRVWVRVKIGGNLPGSTLPGGNFPSTLENIRKLELFLIFHVTRLQNQHCCNNKRAKKR